jgi:hypothetical protein
LIVAEQAPESGILLAASLPSQADEQARMNSSTRGQWDWYASHRRNIERLIVPSGRGQRICVLGAGNCNDLDLKWLVDAYAEVHLVDIDRRAIERAAGRQGVGASERLRLHAPLDLTGINKLTMGWSGRKVSDDEVHVAAGVAGGECGAILDERFDVVISPCVLSQLLCGVRAAVGKAHPAWPVLKAALRLRHLRTVASLLAPGGRGVLVVDLSSTSALPGLDRAREEELEDLMRMCVRERKCFRGLEPTEIAAVIRNDAWMRARLGEGVVSAPWLWHLGWGKAFLVYGMTLVASRKFSAK